MRGRGWPLRRLAEGLLVAMSAVAALAIGEAALRLGGFSYPQLYVTDEVTGSRLRAGAEGWSRGEGEVYVKISSQSLRDREHAVAKPPRTYRIAVLGDSYAEALQVPLEQAFWVLLPRELERCRFAGDRKIEPLNFGVSGYGTAQELLTLRQRAWDFSPDLVLLAFFPGNDVGSGPESGVTFPSFERVAHGFELPFHRCADHATLAATICATLAEPGPAICEIVLDLSQPFAPKVSSKRLPDGRMVTAPLEDMAPFLPREEFLSNMLVPTVHDDDP
jgi:hypothetical protein